MLFRYATYFFLVFLLGCAENSTEKLDDGGQVVVVCTTGMVADLAQRIGAKGSSVTQAVKRLSQKNLVTVVPYKGVQLTAEGVELAKSILRKHRLWETFLVDKLGFGWDEVHPLAEQLEHVQSEELVERLSNFLGAPKHDPHGDPIPQPNGQMPPVLGEPIGAFAKGHTIKVVRVEDAGSEFFDQLDAMNINLGNQEVNTNDIKNL